MNANQNAIRKQIQSYVLVSAAMKTVEAGKQNAGNHYIEATFMPRDVDPVLGMTKTRRVMFFQPQGSQEIVQQWADAWKTKKENPASLTVVGGIFTKDTVPHNRIHTDSSHGGVKGEAIMAKDENGVMRRKVWNTLSVFAMCDNDGNPLESVETLMDRMWTQMCRPVVVNAAPVQTPPASNPATDAATLIGGGQNPVNNIDF